MPLSFRPACLPFAQSSLPHYHTSQAIQLLRTTTPDMLMWPCLPQRGFHEYVHVQSAQGFPGLVLDETTLRAYVSRDRADQYLAKLGLAYLEQQTAFSALSAHDAVGLAEVLGWSEQRTVPHRAIASQMTGPISLSLQLTDEQYRPLIYEPLLREALAQHLALRAGWLASRISHVVEDTIVCLDEPLLAALSSPFCPMSWEDGVELLEQVFQGTPACCGLFLGEFGARQPHHSPSRRWGLLLETSVEFVLVDVYQASSVLLAAVGMLPELFDREGILGWGIVPNNYDALARETPDTLVGQFEQTLDQLVEAGLSREQVVLSSLISTNGGLAHLPIVIAEQALQLCVGVSQQLRAKYGLTDE